LFPPVWPLRARKKGEKGELSQATYVSIVSTPRAVGRCTIGACSDIKQRSPSEMVFRSFVQSDTRGGAKTGEGRCGAVEVGRLHLSRFSRGVTGSLVKKGRFYSGISVEQRPQKLLKEEVLTSHVVNFQLPLSGIEEASHSLAGSPTECAFSSTNIHILYSAARAAVSTRAGSAENVAALHPASHRKQMCRRRCRERAGVLLSKRTRRCT